MTVPNHSSSPAPRANTPAGEASPPASTAIQAGAPASPSSTAIQAKAPAADSSIPLPPLPAEPRRQISPTQLAHEIARLDRVLVVIVLLLAFLCASFAVRNSDFWMHLASGRLLAYGQYAFGVDSYSYMSIGSGTHDPYWTNNSWLYDVFLYLTTRIIGGPESSVGGALLVIVKALFITLLAWILLQIRQPGQSRWASVVCVVLALAAMSQRLYFQPTLISLLFLALTLYVLLYPRPVEGRDRRAERGKRSPWAIYWLLPVLFLFWVNLDSWFFVGLATIGLFLLGQILQQVLTPMEAVEDKPPPGQIRTLFLVLGASLVACVLNPHHYHTFALPVELSLQTPVKVLQTDDYMRRFFYWLLDENYTDSATKEIWFLDSLAYFTLGALGILSFVLNVLAGFRWWRLLVWLAFFALSVFQLRAVPFFVVVAAPITALNFQDFVSATFGGQLRVQRGWVLWSILGRLATLVGVVVVILLVWPGWLHGLPLDPRLGDARLFRVRWSVEPDASLRQAAEQLKEWRTQGVLSPEEQGFAFAPDIVNYCAWYCADDQTGLPLEKGFYDYRFPLFSESVTAEYIGLRQALRELGGAHPDTAVPLASLPEVFHRQKITHVILNANDRDNEGVAMGLQADYDRWPLVYLDGKTSIYRWNDPLKRGSVPSRLKRFDPNPLAFGPSASVERAPATGPDRPEKLNWLALYWKGPAPQPLDTEKAHRYDLLWSQQVLPWREPYLGGLEWAAWAGLASLTGANQATSTVVAPTNLLWISGPIRTRKRTDFLFLGRDHGPPALPLLAVRAARRAIAVNPSDAQAYFNLAQAYEWLWRFQEDNWLGRQAMTPAQSPRQNLRQLQVITALAYGLRLRPEEHEANKKLSQLYYQMGYIDLAQEHWTQAVNAFAARPPKEGKEERDADKKTLDSLRQGQKMLDDELNKMRSKFLLGSENKPLSVKVDMARDMRWADARWSGKGLAKKALDLLMDADSTQIDVKEANAELELLLTTGQADKVKELLDETLKPRLGWNYDWINIRLAAVLGNYEEAGQYLEEHLVDVQRASTQSLLEVMEQQTLRGTMSPRTLMSMAQSLDEVRSQGDLLVMRGLIALEEGDNPTAARYFRKAEELSNQGQFYFEGRVLAVRYLQLLEAYGGAR